MIISLIGFMGAGKTTMGKQLSEIMKTPFIDLDTYIQEREGKTIAEIFEEKGEAGFREIEENSLQDVLENHISDNPQTIEDLPPFDASESKDDQSIPHRECSLVLSLGGGIVTNPECVELIKRFTYCLYIKTDINTILSRLEKESENRPMLKGEGTLQEIINKLYYEREPLYNAIARKIIKL